MGALIRPQDDQGTVFVATAMGLLVLTVIAIILRLLSRWTAKVGLWWDDYLILLSEVDFFAGVLLDVCDTNVSPVPAGSGIHRRFAWYYWQLKSEKLLLTLIGVSAGQHLQHNRLEKLDAQLRVRDFHETSGTLETYLQRILQFWYANMLFYPALMVRNLYSFLPSSVVLRDVARIPMAKYLSYESL